MSDNKRRPNIKTTLLTVTGALLLSAFTAAPAFAKTCKDVYVQATNQTGGNIKIIDLDYWDDESEKWRSKPVKNEEIKKGLLWQQTFNLQRVNNQDVKIRIEYRKAKWNKLLKKWKWAAKKSKAISSMKKCSRGSQYIMTIK